MLLRKEIKTMCELYNLNYAETYDKLRKSTDGYFSIFKNYIEIEILQSVLDGLVRIEHRVETKEGYTLIEMITEQEVLNIKHFDIKKLFNQDLLSLEENKAKNSIIRMIIPKIFIKYAEIYNEERYLSMYE